MNALQYRHYNLPIEFPVIAFIGSNWTVTEEAPAVYHFHNCMEIGRCNTGSGTVHTFLGSFPYHEGEHAAKRKRNAEPVGILLF